MRNFAPFLLLILLSGCDTLSYQYDRAQDRIAEALIPGAKQPTSVNAVQAVEPSEADLPQPREEAAAPAKHPADYLITATGYAPISAQPGATQQQKMLNAMRASKLRAYQELAAMVHGQYLFGTSRVSDMVLQSDQFDTAVAGIVRGAQVVKSYPVQDDTYATILQLDMRRVQRAWIDMQ